MEWTDEGILLAARPLGEGKAILHVLTAAHGRHVGVAPGAASRRQAPLLQPGTQLAVRWRARLDAHMGTWTVEPLRSRAAALMETAAAGAAMASVAALATAFLPERDPCPGFYALTCALADALGRDDAWPQAYARWELALLAEAGFGLDLTACAVTGATDDLAWVSPRSGRAVSRAGAGNWTPRLLPLPALFRDGDGPAAEALALTGHFLTAWAAPAVNLPAPPEARARLLRLLG